MDVHVHDVRRFVEKVIVQRSDFNSGIDQLLHDRSNLRFGQNEVSHHIGVTSHAGEVGP